MLLCQYFDAFIFVIVCEIVYEKPLDPCLDLLKFSLDSFFALFYDTGDVGLRACVLETNFVPILRPHAFQGLKAPIVLDF